MRTRIITSPAFNGDRVVGAILFEKTMDSQIEGKLSGDYLWSAKQVVPFLKIDKGLEAEGDGVQLMKPIPNLVAPPLNPPRRWPPASGAADMAAKAV